MNRVIYLGSTLAQTTGLLPGGQFDSITTRGKIVSLPRIKLD